MLEALIDDEVAGDDATPTRQYYANLVDHASTAEQLGDIAALFGTLEHALLSVALPSLCSLAEKLIESQQENPTARDFVLCVAHATLTSDIYGRGERKAALATLKVFYETNQDWKTFFVLADCLEEPQFHIIRPVLPCFATLLDLAARGAFEWRWIEVVLVRALAHSNGWVRLWALEKAADVPPPLLAKNTEFLSRRIFSALNSNDLMWRLLENERLLEYVKRLGDQLNAILTCSIANGEGLKFVRQLIKDFQMLSCPFAYYFISKAYMQIKSFPCLEDNDLSGLRQSLNRIHYINYNSIRAVTAAQIIVFFARLANWNSCKSYDTIAAALSDVREDAPKMLGYIERELTSVWLQCTSDCGAREKRDVSAILSRPVEESTAALDWIHARALDYEDLLFAEVSLALSERLSDGDPSLYAQLQGEIDRLLLSVVESGKELADGLQPLTVDYLVFRISSMTGETRDQKIVNDIYCPLLMSLNKKWLSVLPTLLGSIVERSLPTERLALLLSVYEVVTRQLKPSEEFRNSVFGSGLAALQLPRTKKTIADMPSKEFNLVSAKLHSTYLKLFLRNISKNLPTDADQVDEWLTEALQLLDCASAFSVKEQILLLIRMLVSKSTNNALVLSAINATYAVVNEERKSLNCLPATEHFLRIAVQENIMAMDEASARVKNLVDDFLVLSNMNVSIALLLSKIFADCHKILPDDWCDYVVKLAVFGPVPKKDTRVQWAAYGIVYEDFEGRLPDNDLERLHEIVHRSRWTAICTCVCASDESSSKANRYLDACLQECAELDQLSSRSFGLSLAHRQKTRTVALMLLLTRFCDTQDMLQRILDYSVECIVDPCQQFSIKLLVEWNMARIGLKSNSFRKHILQLGSSLAQRRIGSVSSWINVLVLISRGTTNADTLSELIGCIAPWCCAQNFAVRCSAIAAARLLYGYLPEAERPKFSIVRDIAYFDAEPAGNSRRIIDNLSEDFYFARLDAERNFDMETVLTIVSRNTGMPPEELLPRHLMKDCELTPIRRLSDDEGFLNAPSLVYAALAKNNKCAPSFESDAVGEGDQEEEEQGNGGDVPSTDADGTPSVAASFQRKIVTKQREKNADCSMIVVASLVSKTSNLGGLCRTSEIFGVDSLVIADLQMVSDTSFKALSMSSEKWQNIEAVRPNDLLPYLESLRERGYTVIAAEQSTDSVPMHKLQFPKKCVLLIGDEKEGVPTRLLRAVDRTVEIEQLGQTRSLNVHVTAALFIAKYAEQILLV